MYQNIYKIVQLIPFGRVATYGQIAKIVGNCTARMVGYALAATPEDIKIPWHRVINSQGKISLVALEDLQRKLLESEGIIFDNSGRVNLNKYRWNAQ
ncbi:MAG: methylated-DNA--[protein]-cysteine S-methyltransferase [Calditrichaceae bacterium]|nr:methylated-DNA--[protein]-cysteine S-methyltransferase [Calditrichaceae bacterium]